MLQNHIKKHAIYLDEENYVLKLPAMISNENELFSDNDGLDDNWLIEYWRSMFDSKFSVVNPNIFDGSKILDACCGRGFLGEYLLENYDADITFCDLSSYQLNDLEKRITNKYPGCHKIIKSSIEKIPVDNNSFDFVMGNSFLHHIQDVPSVINELSRVLKNSGKLVLLHEPSLKSTFYESFPISLLKNTNSGSGFTDLWMFDANKLRKIILKNGFTSVKIYGSGLLGSVFINWYTIIMSKFGATDRRWILPALLAKERLYKLENKLMPVSNCEIFPSLTIVAEK